MNRVAPVPEEHSFRDKDFVGGDVVLDFVNTVTGRNGRPRDWITGFPALADWAARTELLPRHRCQRLKGRSRQSAPAAARALGSARHFREILFRVLTQTVDRGASASDLNRLSIYWRRSIGHHALRSVPGSIQPVLADSSINLDEIVDALALRAVELLRELPTTRLRQCAGPNCAWLFIDSSKAGRRRWCDMATCGNDAKARRHYFRTKNVQVPRRADPVATWPRFATKRRS